MKYLLTFLLMLLCGSSISAQDRYFHDLKGLEENGNSILFYQMTQMDDFQTHGKLYSDFLYRYNTSQQKDSLLARLSYNIYATGVVSIDRLQGFMPVSSKQVFLQSSFADEDYIGIAVSDTKNGSSIGFQFLSLTNINYSESSLDTIYVSSYSGTTPVPLDSGKAIQESFFQSKDVYSYFSENADPFHIIDFSPFQDSVSFSVKDGVFLKSENLNQSFQTLEYDGFANFDFSKTENRLLFDPDSVHIFALTNNELIRSNNFGEPQSWLELQIPDSISSPDNLTLDNSISGKLFISGSSSVYHSSDYGASFDMLLEFDSQITGLYKKPNSNILYVLTKTDLYKVENGQPTSIKQVPVRNEEALEIPNAVSLKQNYPNPFNPTTTIEFELDKTTFTKLTVFDVLGRKVRELVNEIRPAGTNTIEFNATNLASGVYLYRLEANGVVQTKRLTLIK